MRSLIVLLVLVGTIATHTIPQHVLDDARQSYDAKSPFVYTTHDDVIVQQNKAAIEKVR